MKPMSYVSLLLLVACLALAGCETAKGFGRDMQKAGNWIEEKATK